MDFGGYFPKALIWIRAIRTITLLFYEYIFFGKVFPPTIDHWIIDFWGILLKDHLINNREFLKFFSRTIRQTLLHFFRTMCSTTVIFMKFFSKTTNNRGFLFFGIARMFLQGSVISKAFLENLTRIIRTIHLEHLSIFIFRRPFLDFFQRSSDE